MHFSNSISCHNNGYRCFLQTGKETIVCPQGRNVTSVALLKFFLISISLCCVKDLPDTKVLFSAEILKDKGHLCKVVALQPLVGTEVECDIYEKTELPPTQVKSTYINGGL
jgi:hypothetical protein